MSTPFQKVYDAFLAKILDDEWGHWTMEEMECDLKAILLGALPSFKFPRVSLEYNDDGFVEELSNEEIQIIANYMKCEWLNRCILTWENVKTLYEERDFSQANLLDKLGQALEREQKNALRVESLYYRSIKGKSYKYRILAG